MNCDISDYRENWKNWKKYIKEISNLPVGTRHLIMKKIKNGYIFTNYEQYRIDCRKNVSQAIRKYDYGDVDFVPKEKRNKTGFVNLTDGYIAFTLKAKVNEVPKEVIETKRLIIQLKRELKSNNIKTK